MLKSVPLIMVQPESSMTFLTNWNSKPEVSKPMPVLSLPPYNWAVKQGFVKTNYFSGKITLANKDDITSAKQPFSTDEMKFILGPKLLGWSFLEHNTVRGRFGKRRQPTPDYYWVVNIAAYTGAQLGEIVQLTTDDVESKDDIWCFSFNNRDGKRIKKPFFLSSSTRSS